MEIAQAEKVAFFFDDFQWIDQASLYVIDCLLLRQRTKACFIATMNLKDQECPLKDFLPRLKTREGFGATQLKPLTAQETSILISSFFPGRPSYPEYDTALYESSQGNPGYLMHLIQLLSYRKLIQKTSKGWEFTIFESQNLPFDWEMLISSLTAALGDEANEVMQQASILGSGSYLNMLSQACGKDEKQVEKVLKRLENFGIIKWENEDSVKFTSTTFQKTYYKTIDEESRNECILRLVNCS